MASYWNLLTRSNPFVKADCSADCSAAAMASDDRVGVMTAGIGGFIPKGTIPSIPTQGVTFGSAKYYGLCGFGGMLSCGFTHFLVLPLDLVKCRMQVNPGKYAGMISGFKVTLNDEGPRGLLKGWAPTLIGYSMQGAGKFGFYELFKVLYGGMLGEENAYRYRSALYLAAAGSAEFLADLTLSPMECVKVRIQTQPKFVNTLREAVPLIMHKEGVRAFYAPLVPLWLRQIPYTMTKMASFEKTVELLYQYVVPKSRDQCSKTEQLVITFSAGYIAGIICAIVSHPADTMVSKMSQDTTAASTIMKELGWRGLWIGLPTRIVMVGTLTALQWFIYDGVKVAFSLPRPPPPEMPQLLKNKLAE